MRRSLLAIMPLVSLAACSPPPLPAVVLVPAPTALDALYRPARVVSGRLEYAPDRSTFAPILTERAAYPTQPQANDAYRRLVLDGPPELRSASVRLFGCRPGVLDGQTARLHRVSGLVVHCATDFLDGYGRLLGRRTANFAYVGGVWTMQPVNAPRAPVSWLYRERSPRDPWSWVPGRDRYE